MVANQKLSKEQIGAIRKGLELGRQLQIDLPEIAENFRNGMFAREIVDKHNLISKYGISRRIMISSIYNALRGSNGGFEIDPYDGLIEAGELERLTHGHNVKSWSVVGTNAYRRGLGIHARTKEQMTEDGRKGGKRAHELGVGVHGLTREQRVENGSVGGYRGGERSLELKVGIHGRTPEQMREDRIKGGRKGGRKGGKRAHELGVGVHGLTREQLSNIGKKAGRRTYELRVGVHGRTPEQMTEDSRKAIISRGFVPWKQREIVENVEYPFCVLSEIEFAYALSQMFEYRRGSTVNNKLIAERLNELYHDGGQIRNRESVLGALYTFRKQKGKTR